MLTCVHVSWVSLRPNVSSLVRVSRLQITTAHFIMENSASNNGTTSGNRKRSYEDYVRDKLERELAELRTKYEKLNEEQQKVVECPICTSLPREGPVPCCPRGHFVCAPCLKKWQEVQDNRDTCPTCRSPMGTGTSLLAITVIKNALHSCKNSDCTTKTPLEQIKDHEKECEFRPVLCPGSSTCGRILPFNSIRGHVAECTTTMWPPKESRRMTKSLNISKECTRDKRDFTWKTTIIIYEQKLLFCRKFRKNDIYYFDVILNGNEGDCKKIWISLSVDDINSGQPIYKSSFYPRYMKTGSSELVQFLHIFLTLES